jgi:hypothetical protein
MLFVPLQNNNHLFAIAAKAGYLGGGAGNHTPALGCVGVDGLLESFGVEFPSEPFVFLGEDLLFLHVDVGFPATDLTRGKSSLSREFIPAKSYAKSLAADKPFLHCLQMGHFIISLSTLLPVFLRDGPGRHRRGGALGDRRRSRDSLNPGRAEYTNARSNLWAESRCHV